MKMNSARLEIFADDVDSPPHLSRSIPAALDGLVDYKTFQEFADEMDVLLELQDTDHQRFRNRSSWQQYGFNSLLLGIVFMFHHNIILYFVWLCTSILYILSVWIYTTYWLKGPKSAEEIVTEIRSTCEIMSNRTPNVSFHPIFLQAAAGVRLMETITHINVSISDTILASVTSGVAVIEIKANNKIDMESPVVNASTKAASDYQRLTVA